MLSHSTTSLLFESTDNHHVLRDPVNREWLALVDAISPERYDVLARLYYVALNHWGRQRARPADPGPVALVSVTEPSPAPPVAPRRRGRLEVFAQGVKSALQAVLERLTRRNAKEQPSAAETFVETGPDAGDASLPDVLKDFSKPPPPLSALLSGPGRPPCDMLCLMRAFAAAPLLGVSDSPTGVYQLLRSNPTFARACGFLGPRAYKQPGELTSRRTPTRAVCVEFDEVMTRYDLWQHARVAQVRENLARGVVEKEDTVAFDTTHLEAHSHCANVLPPDVKVEDGKKPKHRKVPRLRKYCACGKAQWETCEHPWSPTDEGAAVVVKGPSRIYWAHKTSVVSYGRSEVPLDARVLNYAAQHDGKTLLPHLAVLGEQMPEVVEAMRHALADSAYVGYAEAVGRLYPRVHLHVPVVGREAKAGLAKEFTGIERFMPSGVPVCEGGFAFEMRGRDVVNERYIWAAPDGEDGRSVCAGCPLATGCVGASARRQIRVARADQPQITWEHPEHLARNRRRYGERTGVERAIKRLKVDLDGQHLTHRDAHRVQAHLDRRLLTLHLLLMVAAKQQRGRGARAA